MSSSSATEAVAATPDPRSPDARQVATRSFWGLVSQAINSVSNLGLALIVARGVSPAAFGAWSLGYVGYMVGLTFNRSVASMPMMLARGDLAQPPRGQVRGCISTAAVAGLVTSACLFAIGLVAGHASPVRSAAWAFALFLPALLAQDALRYVFFRRGEPHRAALLDLTWICIQVAAFSILIMTGQAGLWTTTCAWGAGALVAAVLGAWILKVCPSWPAFLIFVAEHRWVSLRLTADSLLNALSTYLLPVIVVATSGLAAAGALRAGQTLVGGIAMLVMGLTPVITLETMRALKAGTSERKILWLWTLGLAAVAASYGVAALLLPDSGGRLLLGKNWPGASSVLLPLLLQCLVRGPFTGAPLILRAKRDLNGLLRLRLKITAPSLLCPAVGAVLGGAVGAAWGIFVGAVVVDVFCVLAVSHRRAIGALTAEDAMLPEDSSP